VSKQKNIATPGIVVGVFRGSCCEIVDRVLSFSAVYAAVAKVTRFLRFLRLFLEIVNEIVGKIVRLLDSSDNWAHNLW
jgi:hypothetical protein